MARFNDLAVEIQEAIWDLVLPAQGGVQYIQLEGIPRALADVERKPQGKLGDEGHESDRFAKDGNNVYLFRRLYAAVPSVWGMQPPHLLPDTRKTGSPTAQEALARHYRNISSYAQVATLLSTCRLSRAVALHFQAGMVRPCQLTRGLGPAARPRNLLPSPPSPSPEENHCRPQGGHQERPGRDAAVEHGYTLEFTLLKFDRSSDLVVLHLYDPDGSPTPTLRYAHQFRSPQGGYTMPQLPRLGIKWRPEWATTEGRAESLLPGQLVVLAQLQVQYFRADRWVHWIVDGIPRPRWDRMPAAYELAKAATDMMADRNRRFEGVPRSPRLDDEFEGNGRRYYVVYIVNLHYVHQQPCPEEEPWHVALRQPVKAIRDMAKMEELWHWYCFEMPILSWEPI